MSEEKRFEMGPGRWDGRRLWCGCILWDYELGPMPACVGLSIEYLRKGEYEEALDLALEPLRREEGEG
jgi:hypothetical protein